MRAPKFIIVGNVDDGKSTLLGRLMHDTGCLFADQMPDFIEGENGAIDFSHVSDGLRSERAEGITYDLAYKYIQLQSENGQKQSLVVIDSPGHFEFTAKMVAGAVQADFAVIVLDLTRGFREQTQRQLRLLHVFGIQKFIVCLNKIDQVAGCGGAVAPVIYQNLIDEVTGFMAGLGANPPQFVVASALRGWNVAEATDQLPWYKGPSLREIIVRAARAASDITRSGQSRNVQPGGDPIILIQGEAGPQAMSKNWPEGARLFYTQVLKGQIRVGDTVSNLMAGGDAQNILDCKILKIFCGFEERNQVGEGQAASIVFETSEKSAPILFKRGDVLSTVANQRRASTKNLVGSLFWHLSEPLAIGETLVLSRAAKEVTATVVNIAVLGKDRGASPDRREIGRSAPDRREIGRNEIGQVTLRLSEPTFFAFSPNLPELALAQVRRLNSADAAGVFTAHEFQPVVLWLTGLSASGKTTIAEGVARRLKASNIEAHLLDGDAIRALRPQIGFSRTDRVQHSKYVAERAAELEREGGVVIVSLITPFAESRDYARNTCENFCEIYLNTDLAVCEGRDPKGLYKKARSGEIRDFTGINSPYEVPQHPDVTIDTAKSSVDEAVDQVFGLIKTLGIATSFDREL